MDSDSNVDESVPSPPRAAGRRAKKKDGRGRDQAAEAKAAEAAMTAATVEVEVSMERKVESMVTNQFLFLMSNVVSKRWSSRTTKDKIRAIQVGAKFKFPCIDANRVFFSGTGVF